MHTIRIQAQSDDQGRLNFSLPVDQANAAFEVVVVMQPVTAAGWPEGFFEETYGAFADTPIERPEQGEYEQRDELR